MTRLQFGSLMGALMLIASMLSLIMGRLYAGDGMEVLGYLLCMGYGLVAMGFFAVGLFWPD